MSSNEILLDKLKSVRLSDTVVNQIVNLIELGELAIGTRLPGEKDLIDQLNVGRASIREALRILEDRGVIEVRPGKGAYVVRKLSDVTRPEENLRHWFQEHAAEVYDMLDVRHALEKKAASLAASGCSSGEIRAMLQTLDQAEKHLAEENLDVQSELDIRFHRQLAEASHNALLPQLVDFAIEALKGPRRSIQSLPGRAQISLQEHRAIVEALIAGDASAAEQAVDEHIRSVREAVRQLAESKEG